MARNEVGRATSHRATTGPGWPLSHAAHPNADHQASRPSQPEIRAGRIDEKSFRAKTRPPPKRSIAARLTIRHGRDGSGATGGTTASSGSSLGPQVTVMGQMESPVGGQVDHQRPGCHLERQIGSLSERNVTCRIARSFLDKKQGTPSVGHLRRSAGASDRSMAGEESTAPEPAL